MDFSLLNWFDVIIILIVAVSTLLAFFKGFIRTIFSFVNWLGTGFVTYLLYKPVNGFLSAQIGEGIPAMFISSIGLFIVVFIIFILISNIFVSILKGLRLGILDRTLGFAFGFIRGAVIVCLIFFSVTLSYKALSANSDAENGETDPEWLAEAQTNQLLRMGAGFMLSFMGEEMSNGGDMTAMFDGIKDNIADLSGGLMAGKSSDMPSSFTPKERELLKKLLASLPTETVDKIYANYGDENSLSENEKNDLFNDILAEYKQTKYAIDFDKRLSNEELSVIEKALKAYVVEDAAMDEEEASGNADNDQPTSDNEEKEAEDVGYKKHQLKQIDRLIDALDDE